MPKPRKPSVVYIEVDPDIKAAWKRSADASGLSLKEWVTARCNGVGTLTTVVEVVPPDHRTAA